jgi:hypothetical protein
MFYSLRGGLFPRLDAGAPRGIFLVLLSNQLRTWFFLIPWPLALENRLRCGRWKLCIFRCILRASFSALSVPNYEPTVLQHLPELFLPAGISAGVSTCSHKLFGESLFEPCSYDSEKLSHFGVILNVLFSVRTTFTAANLFHCRCAPAHILNYLFGWYESSPYWVSWMLRYSLQSSLHSGPSAAHGVRVAPHKKACLHCVRLVCRSLPTKCHH